MVPLQLGSRDFGPQKMLQLKNENTQHLAIITPVLFLQGFGGCWMTRFVHVAVVLRERESVLRAAGELVLVASHPPPTVSIIVQDDI